MPTQPPPHEAPEAENCSTMTTTTTESHHQTLTHTKAQKISQIHGNLENNA